MDIKIGMVVKHFKRDIVGSEGNNYLYIIESIALDADTQEKVVVYKALYPPFITWTRKLNEFISPVDKHKYPEAKQTFRFEPYNGEIL